MELDEIKYRDRIIRNYVLGRTWDDNEEFHLLQIIILSHRFSWEDDFIWKPYANSWKSIISKEYREGKCDWEKILLKIRELTNYPYIFDYEWEVHEYIEGRKKTIGKGDLIFTDGKDNYLIVEIKYLDLYGLGKTARTRRNFKRKKNLDQTKKYMELFQSVQRNAKTILGLSITNDKITRFLLLKLR